MVEKKILVDDLRLEYTGVFEIKELYELIDKLILERGYIKYEKKSEEFVTETGKQVNLELRPTKNYELDYWAYIKIKLRMTDIKKVTLEVEGKRRQYDQGHVLISMDGWTSTTYEWAWETKPLFVFIRMIFDKYIKKVSFGKYEGEIIIDTKYWYHRIKSFLNLYRFKIDDKSTNEPASMPATSIA